MATVSLNTPDVLVGRGNLELHAQQGATLEVKFYSDANQPVDMTGRMVYFETQGNLRKQFVLGSSNNVMTLTLTQEDVATQAGINEEFVVLDETDPVHELIWQGNIRVRGWN